jgi:hypothetical protein
VTAQLFVLGAGALGGGPLQAAPTGTITVVGTTCTLAYSGGGIYSVDGTLTTKVPLPSIYLSSLEIETGLETCHNGCL